MKASYTIDLETNCWEWNGSLTQGYGTPTYAMRQAGFSYAHRAFYAERHGSCPPTLDHLCRNRACVNPDHLEPCGRGENVRRGDATKLDWDIVRAMRDMASTIAGTKHAQALQVAYLFDVSERTANAIVRNERWREEDRP